jgi:hypothetical protein
VTAFIKSISIFGEMDLEFNASMNRDFNVSLVNTSLVDMYIEPYDRDEDFNMSLVNFTWKLVNTTSNHQFYKLNWTSPYDISPFAE